MNDYFQRVEPLLSQFLMERYWATPWSKEKSLPDHVYKSLATHVKYLSDAFTTSREKLAPDYFRQKEARSAYLLYFHLANVMRNYSVLSNLLSTPLLPKRPLRVLDLGSGLGSASWAFLYAMEQKKINVEELVLVDQDQKVLEDASKLYGKMLKEKLLPEVAHKYLAYDLSKPFQAKKLIHQGAFDVIVSSNMLNEMSGTTVDEMANFFLTRMDEQLADDGVMILVEPAMMKTSRMLTQLRDKLLTSGRVNTPLPCMHNGPCPLNNEPRDWCHFEADWTPPHVRQRLEKSLDHGTGTLKYSYVAFQKGKKPHPPYRKKNAPYRVLSNVLESREGFAVLLCEPEKKISLELGKKRLDVLPQFKKLKRGDVFQHPIEMASQKHPYATSARLKSVKAPEEE